MYYATSLSTIFAQRLAGAALVPGQLTVQFSNKMLNGRKDICQALWKNPWGFFLKAENRYGDDDSIRKQCLWRNCSISTKQQDFAFNGRIFFPVPFLLVMRGLEITDEGFGVTNDEGCGYVPATEEDIELSDGHG